MTRSFPLALFLALAACAHAGRNDLPSPPARVDSTAPGRAEGEGQGEGGAASRSQRPDAHGVVSAAHAEDPRPITIAAVGDVMLGSTFPDASQGALLAPNDGADLLVELAPVLQGADLAFGNLEGPLADAGTSEKCASSKPGRCYAFRVPTRYGAYLASAGFDLFSIANNHAMDMGEEGRASTIATLDKLHIGWAGPPGAVARAEVRGHRIAMVAFATNWGSNDLRELDAARAIVAPLVAEGNLVIVSFHGGGEGAAYQHVAQGPELFLGENRGDVRTFAHAMIDAGAALVLGHGPHVVRAMEVYRGHLVAYSLGNFATYRGFNLVGPNGLSLVLEARIAPDGTFAGGKIHPAKQDPPGGPKADPTGAVIPVVRQLSREDFGPTAVQVADDGTLSAPEAPAPQAAADAPRG